ncbi:hypothetical protein [Streptomyces sp. NPDC005407]|uniref:hypothetical protein n=1 Tax=Streptomyces sp. NPDC005407 TaxID=3155340 RepID=UPI0033A9F662
MGRINIDRNALGRLVPDSGSTYGPSYHQAFNELATTHRGRPPAEILPALRQAADRALLGFTTADLLDQAVAISNGDPYELRMTLT